MKLSVLLENRLKNTKMIITNKPEIVQYKQINLNKTKYCVCKTLGPALMLARLFGVFPVSWRHTTEKCVYEKSLTWLIYTGFVIIFQIFVTYSNVNYSNLLNATLLVIIDNLTNLYYSHYVVLITLLGFFKFTAYITTLNTLASTLKDGVLCQSAMRRVVLLQYAIFASLALVATFQIILYIWLNNSTSYEANFSIMNILYRMFMNFSFGLYAVVFTIFGLLIGSLACFEKYTLNCLKYVPVHPLRDIDDSNNSSDFMGIIHYKLCTENHFITSQMLDLKPADVVENLRIYHEEFSLCIYSWNKSMDLLFLTHTVMELAVLIVDWYAVIAYLVYSFKAPIAATMNILNLFYVVSHTYGLFLFLKNCQALKNIVSIFIFPHCNF